MNSTIIMAIRLSMEYAKLRMNMRLGNIRYSGMIERSVELCLTPSNASWANPIEPQFEHLRTFCYGWLAWSGESDQILRWTGRPDTTSSISACPTSITQPVRPSMPSSVRHQ